MPRNVSAVQAEEVVNEITDEQIQIGLKRLARIRANLKSIRLEISEKILDGVKDCRESISSTMSAVEELNAATKPND